MSTKTLTTCFLIIIGCAASVRSQTAGPTLLTELNSQRAVTFDSVTIVRDPLPVVAQHNLSQDHRTRLTLFGINMDLLPGENASAVTATARDSQSRIYNLNVEFVGKIQVPTFGSITQVIVKLPDQLAQAGDVWLSVTLHGQTSNEVLFSIAIQTQPRFVTLPARRVINGQDNFASACFSFEFGANGPGIQPFLLNDWDILFGNSPSVDTFMVTLAGDDRSKIVDLGALNWSDSFQVPVVPPHPGPVNEPGVNVIVGHMYVVHTKDSNTDLYALLRVESLDPLTRVTISWKSIRSPDGN